MQRNLSLFTTRKFDLLIIGGGIYGACAAWDAALRGLSVALIEQGDFGGATSSNSLKFIHGGLRYLQEANLPLARRMAKERTTWLTIAPYFVKPQPVLFPTAKKLNQRKTVLRCALVLNDLISYGSPLPRSSVTESALWWDGQVQNTERLLLAFLMSASAENATLANYVQATKITPQEVLATDQLTGEPFSIRAKTILNTAPQLPQIVPSLALNLIFPFRASDYATCLPSYPNTPHSRMLFFVPWREYTMIGTYHAHWEGPPNPDAVTLSHIETFLAEINSADPKKQLTVADIAYVHKGFLPAHKPFGSRSGVNHSQTVGRDPHRFPPVKLMRESQIINQGEGMFEMLGVKYTTARLSAEKALNAICKYLNHNAPCRTATTPLHNQHPQKLFFWPPWIHAQPFAVRHHLIDSYGTDAERVLNYLKEDETWKQVIGHNAPILQAEIIHAVRDEMAHSLCDVILRRLGLGSAEKPPPSFIETCAQIMAHECSWSPTRTAQEIADLDAHYTFWQP